MRRGACPLLPIVLAVGPAGCGGGPVRPGPCQAPAGSTPVELVRTEASIRNVAAAEDGFIFTEYRGLGTKEASRHLRRVGREGPAVELATLPDFLEVSLLGAGNEAIWGGIEWTPTVLRTLFSGVPLAGGPPRTVGVGGLEFRDDFHDTPRALTLFAADDRAVYFAISRLGGDTPGGAWIGALSRTDATVTVLARASHDVGSPHLAGGEIWWVENHDEDFVHRVPVQGPPAVETLLVQDCRSLRAAADGSFFCGGVTEIRRYDRDGRHPEVLYDATNENGGGPTLVPLAVDGEWLWLLESVPGNVRKLHLPSSQLSDVLCERIQYRRLTLGTRDLVWLEEPALGKTGLSTLQRLPRD